MKSKHIIAITALTFASLTSCTSVLDKDDLTAVSEKATWNSEILSTAFLDKCYKDNLPSFSGDYSKYSDEGNGGGDFIHGRLTAVATAGGPLGEHWPYDKIYTINVLLTSIDGGSLSEDIRNRIKAQALFLRAYQYFEMVKIYGGVPLILTPQDRHSDDLYVTRNTAKECIDQIVKDLDDAAASLPSIWGENDFGRITKGAAMAFKGRVLLTYASKQFNPNNDRTRWQTAYNACLAAQKELSENGQRALHPIYKEIWTKETTSETVITTRFLDPVRTHNFMAGLRPLEFSVGATGNHHPTLDMALAFPMADGTTPGVDVNGDGVVNDNDKVAIGATTTPNLVYGIGASFAWKGIDVNVHFQGAGKSTFPIYGKCVYAFSESDWGNIFKDMISDRWVDSETAAKLGLHANENPNATYPRLTYGENKNNQQTSTYWMRDGRYIRLKNLDIGYTLPKSIVNKLHFNNIRIYIAGSNLITWSKFKTWDPETGNPRGEAYPLTKSVTMGLSVNL